MIVVGRSATIRDVASGPHEADRRRRSLDVRLRGFADRVSVERAQAWVDQHAARLAPVDVSVEEALVRVLAAPLAAREDHPPIARAREDGYAARSADTVGASTYNPVTLRLCSPSGLVGSGAAALVAAGAAVPAGADAIVGFDAAQRAGPELEVIAAVAEGAGIERRGQQVHAGAPLGVDGRPLRAHDVAFLASLRLERVAVVGRPRASLVVAGAKPAAGRAASDAHGPMLRAVVQRDGGVLEPSGAGADLRIAILRAASEPRPDLVIVTGRTGTGPDDDAPLALADAGELPIHGVALRPGGSVAMGVASEVPVFSLPGDPLACLLAYELFAGRLVRGLGGRAPGLPHRTLVAELTRKIVSSVGSMDVCQVRLVAGRAEPLGVLESGGLAAAARADGFVIVPAPLEGYAPGALVTVHTY
ncbi:MAG: molybdopterin-binding protein [Microvirga sp.]